MSINEKQNKTDVGNGLKSLLSIENDNVFNHIIEIQSISTQQSIRFPAFITQFNDSYKSDWNTTQIYGRMDPIATFKNTTRKITLAFDIPSHSIEEAVFNNTQLDLLISSLYPIYSKDGESSRGTSIIGTPPLFIISYANLIVDANAKGGILCFLDGFDYAPDIEAGFFTTKTHVFPKLFKATLNINVIHRTPLGREIKNDINVTRGGLIEYNHFTKPPNLIAVKELGKGTNYIEVRDNPDGRYGDAIPKVDTQNKSKTVK